MTAERQQSSTDAWMYRLLACVNVVSTRYAALRAQVYVRAILPIGALFSVTLWLGNTAMMYISVAFAQMLKVRCAGPAVFTLRTCSFTDCHATGPPCMYT